MRKAELQERVKPVPKAVSQQLLDDVFFKICESIDSPKSLAASILFDGKEFDQLLALTLNKHYDNSTAFADDYLVISFLSKYKHFDLAVDPEEVAYRKFLDFENVCKVTNDRFSELRNDPSKWDSTLNSIFRRARASISRVLGKPDLDKIADGFGWGPGATNVAKGSRTTAYDKFKMSLSVTSNALIMGHCCVNSIPAWANCQLQTDSFPSIDISLTRESFSIVRGNEIVFVPKNAKTHRTIAIEPHVNSYLQKGFGSYIRRRLKRYAGVDLNDQTINQSLAKRASIDGLLATIDLSGASDTISLELVKTLLPSDWYSLLDSCRSKQGYDSKAEHWIYYHKFSSMGNGFTFELESLIFWALCEACLDGNEADPIISVYGDDIIIPVEAFDLVVRVLSFAGFAINESKTFVSGPFRESCGKDYYLGNDVRPIFQKDDISNVESIYKLANSIRRYSHRRNFNYGCDVRFLPVWSALVNSLSPTFRELKIPEGYGDGGLISNFDEATPSRPPNGWEGWSYKQLSRRPLKKAMRDSHSGYTTVLSVVGSEEPLLGFVNPRNKTYCKVARCYTWEWYNIGPWS